MTLPTINQIQWSINKLRDVHAPVCDEAADRLKSILEVMQGPVELPPAATTVRIHEPVWTREQLESAIQADRLRRQEPAKEPSEQTLADMAAILERKIIEGVLRDVTVALSNFSEPFRGGAASAIEEVEIRLKEAWDRLPQPTPAAAQVDRDSVIQECIDALPGYRSGESDWSEGRNAAIDQADKNLRALKGKP